MLTITEQDRAALGEPEDWALERDSHRPLAFTGWQLAEADDKHLRCGHSGFPKDATRWTTVSVFLTVGGRLVVRRAHQTKWQGEHDRVAARSFVGPAEALAWMQGDHDGTMGEASRLAWADACERVEALAPWAAERVE